MYCQSDYEKSMAKLDSGVTMVDRGNYDDGLRLYAEAKKLDSTNITIDYEIAYVYYGQKKYDTAIYIIEKIIDNGKVNDRFYQLLGNAYDFIGKIDKAIQVYNKGLQKFPKSGTLNHELSVIYAAQKDYDKAIEYCEAGIEVDPTYPTNYFTAAVLYFDTKNSFWGMMYAEIFMNLERNTKRTSTMSKLLFDNYKKHILRTDSNKFEVKFASNYVTSKKPFGLIVYEPCILLSLFKAQSIFAKDSLNLNINNIDTIRTNFLSLYYERQFDTLYPNVLFEYQKKIQEAGFLDVYNHWLLMYGDPDLYTKWIKQNQQKAEAFVKWFDDNPIMIDEKHRLYKNQYN